MQSSQVSVTDRAEVTMHGRFERGFSLVELLIAMVVTGIIAGAIYGMMIVGQNSMRREPELVDRQDNIRMAMNLIERDLQTAGMAMGAQNQVFTQTDATSGAFLDGASVVVGPGGTTPAGTTNKILFSNGHFMDSTPPSTPGFAGIPAYSAGKETHPDFLEFIGHEGNCPDDPTSCPNSGNHPCDDGSNLLLQAPMPSCYGGANSLVYIIWDTGGGKWGVAHTATSAGGGSATNFPQGQQGVMPCPNNATGMVCQGSQDFRVPQAAPYQGKPQRILQMSLIRYEVAPCDATDPSPCLFRSDVGGHGVGGAGVFSAPPGGTWQLVARGVEDMQIVYTTLAADGVTPVYTNSPPLVQVDANGVVDFTTVVRDVRVTLGARTLANSSSRLAGQGQAANTNAAVAIRGNLTRVITIPATLEELNGIDPVNGPQQALYWK
jgi:prepilin-type N-terminal cleavage/methylation domain-containing protein